MKWHSGYEFRGHGKYLGGGGHCHGGCEIPHVTHPVGGEDRKGRGKSSHKPGSERCGGDQRGAVAGGRGVGGWHEKRIVRKRWWPSRQR